MNDLASSNFLTEGGLLQTGPDQFILFIGRPQPVSRAHSDQSQQLFMYHSCFWDHLSVDRYSRQQALSVFDHTVIVTKTELIDWLAAHAESRKVSLQFKNDHSSEFASQYEWSQNLFKSGALKKTVPFTVFEYDLATSFPFSYHLYQSLLQKRPGYLYGMWNSESGFLGLTPETLIQWDGKNISTMALAGTWSPDDQIIHPDQLDLKIREEHQFVIQDICEKLNHDNDKLAVVQKTQILNLPVLSHLKTEIQQPCHNQQDFIRGIEKLHPTAALGIYPKSDQLALEFSKLPLQNQRNDFGAPFGVIGNNWGHVVVAIRYLTWNVQTLKIYVGCGVTAQSQLAQEWAELELKKQSICEAFSLSELNNTNSSAQQKLMKEIKSNDD